MLFICTKFQGDQAWIDCFITIFEKCAKWIIKASRASWRLLKKKFFFESLLAQILGMLWKIFFKFEMWPFLSGGCLHCKLGDIRIRHHGATYAWKRLFCSCQYTHVVRAHPVFLGRMIHYWYPTHGLSMIPGYVHCFWFINGVLALLCLTVNVIDVPM